MEYQFTLPALQIRLDALGEMQSLTLANRQIQTLFGLNDVAHARMKRFAQGHNCIAFFSDNCVIFRKMPGGGSRSAPS